MTLRDNQKPYIFLLSRSVGHGRARSGVSRLVIVGGAAGLLIGAAALWRTPISGTLWRILAPIASVRDGATQAVSSVGNVTRSTQSLTEENNALHAQVQELQQRLVDRDALYQENLTLKQQYAREDFDVSHPVLAGILARPPQLPYDQLIIDAGKDHGLSIGNMASVGSAVIGTVVEVYPHNARVELFSSAGKETGGILGGNFVTAEGQGSGAMMVRLPTGVSAAVNNPIVLAGINGGVFGIVTRIETSASSALKSVYLRSPINLNTVKFLMIDTDAKHMFSIDAFLNATTSTSTASVTATSTASATTESGTTSIMNATLTGALATTTKTATTSTPKSTAKKHR